MKLSTLFVFIMAVLALLIGHSEAAPKVNVGGAGNVIKKGGKIIKHGLGAVGAIGTGHEIYEHVHNRN
ncbi:moricin-like [Maniola hyperantus]|uniref:moricin-like n=1 Tax=Aphantopus hyperantus TaxID=2795564 RepID=UPI003749E7C1